MTGAETKEGRWPIWLLAVAFYPLTAGAAYVNLFFLFLMLQALGVPALSTLQSVAGGVVLGIPFAWITGKWIRGMIDQAEEEADKNG